LEFFLDAGAMGLVGLVADAQIVSNLSVVVAKTESLKHSQPIGEVFAAAPPDTNLSLIAATILSVT
jgi:hypothetical protein